MQWVDDAILLSIRKYGENKAVARVFARTHGVFAGIVRGATSKTNRGHLQSGNAVSVTWQARLAEQMGTFKVEPVKPFSAFVMQDRFKLAALSSACALMETSLPERHPYPKLYATFYAFLEHLSESDNWQEEYVKLELAILAESGFGLDLSRCAATGTTENLIYVSPKSGRAVSAEAGEPYKEKLLTLPDFLNSSPQRGEAGRGARLEDGVSLSPPPSAFAKASADANLPPLRGGIIDGLALTGYFLEHWLAEPHGKKLPAARARLWELLREKEPA